MILWAGIQGVLPISSFAAAEESIDLKPSGSPIATGHKCGYINSNYEYVIPAQYGGCGIFASNGLAAVRTSNSKIRYSLSRWEALTRYTDDGRLEMTNNTAERAIRPLTLGRKNYLFAGADSGGHHAATVYTIIETAKLNSVNPEAYLADVIGRIADHPIKKIEELLPWRWKV